MKGISIEAYSESDLPDMIKIWNEVVEKGEAFPQEEFLSLETAKQFFAEQSYCGVAKVERDGEICGLYILHPNNIGRCGHICNASYAVSIKRRGSGIGRLLVQDSLGTAAVLGFKLIQFNAVAVDNLAAQYLYESLGFQELGIIEGGFHSKNGKYKDIKLYWRKL